MKIKLLAPLLCLPFFFSCGIDNVLYLEHVRRNSFNDDSSEDYKSFVEFKTSDSDNTKKATDSFKGFEIYYKIYEKDSERSTDAGHIYERIDKYPADSTRYVIETKGYKRVLKENDPSALPLVKAAANDRLVKVRLTDYGSGNTLEKAGLYIDGTFVDSVIRENKQKFDKENININQDDVVKTSSDDKGEFWYINMYAAAYGFNDSFIPIYSKLEAIGYLKIKK